MKTGIELIAQERAEQIEKHQYQLMHDVAVNQNGELAQVSIYILNNYLSGYAPNQDYPRNWNHDFKFKIDNGKTKKQLLVIAAAMIAAEIDRIQVY